MNILFLGLSPIDSLNRCDMYVDILRILSRNGHSVFSVTSLERRKKRSTQLIKDSNCRLLLVKTFNIQKTNILEKGIGTLAIKRQFIRAIKKHLKGIKFDVILYPTPPITLCGVVKFFKKRDSANTYLMLKDIFPQNAVDIGLMKETGLKGLIYKFFRKQEKNLYAVSDKIGCMSPANVEYVIKHNPQIEKNRIELFPNCIDVQNIILSRTEKRQIRAEYGLPAEKTIFVYGGNLGKPQGIPFIIECLKAESDNEKAFFLIIGDGTEYQKLEQYLNETKQKNFKLLKRLPTDEFDRVLASCDVGLIFLDYRFTIPNFPSRLLSYMQAGLPVLACTDIATDVGKTIIDGGFGWWCKSDTTTDFTILVDSILECNLKEYGKKAFSYLNRHYSVELFYKRIINGNLK